MAHVGLDGALEGLEQDDTHSLHILVFCIGRGGRERARTWASTVRLSVWSRTRVSVEGAPPTGQSSERATWACREPCSCLVGAPALRMCWNCTRSIW